ncbi:hypothetical protein A3H22_03920 [Candidatus Peribacteria bacterium RIFCSPLOWO2_12_FULL_55_15]|nr:MAG: hypothetical protein A2789_03915 [Candidatus Peribacteria bacterium RIFCSPHIGHO2_01_FULL_54_22]OGJ62370.1 MAG: hypothetical protein A3D12_01960 [Candidatus Peribacteria bacterium RIFCSPHIGHO2_02_FULL_55_24]OGJ65234.1 MAG: hypothetical protein A3E47_01395 [Candidatus Peribacteria bacterium RIFCSPHIGHO2_12_FULL_54_10]OGJ68515.1 MAG: hypothetical protein A2947_02035 [Candidatus Peribacteria bacterium RIFCSPLOWO2_01_FULL_54_110]OGJ69085.1 MAG: hypothetical protein A3H90_02280 [Candidatus Pe
MLLVIVGPQSIGKDALITEFLNRHPAWRYMAVEESATAEFVPEDGEEESSIDLDMTEFYVNIACQCAQELRKEDLHLVASCARIPLPLQQFIREEMGPEFVAAHIGHEEELPQSERSLYHCTVNSSTKTLKETLTILDRLVGRKRR